MKNSLKNLYFIINYCFLNYNILFTIYISIIIIASLLFAYKFALMFPNIVSNNYIILENIPFNHGNLIDNLINNNSYKVNLYGIDVYLDRLPFVAFITIAISKLSSNIYLFLLIKNILLFSLFFLFLKSYYYNNISKNPFFFLIFFLLIFFNLYNFQTSLNFIFAEGYISILLPCLFVILIDKKLKDQ